MEATRSGSHRARVQRRGQNFRRTARRSRSQAITKVKQTSTLCPLPAVFPGESPTSQALTLFPDGRTTAKIFYLPQCEIVQRAECFGYSPFLPEADSPRRCRFRARGKDRIPKTARISRIVPCPCPLGPGLIIVAARLRPFGLPISPIRRSSACREKIRWI